MLIITFNTVSLSALNMNMKLIIFSIITSFGWPRLMDTQYGNCGSYILFSCRIYIL